MLGVGPRAVGNAGGGGDGVLVGRSVDRVGDPGVPQGLNLASIVVVLGIVNPSGAEGKFIHVLVELVAELVDTHKSTGLGVTDVVELMPVFLEANLAQIAEGSGEVGHDGQRRARAN